MQSDIQIGSLPLYTFLFECFEKEVEILPNKSRKIRLFTS